MSKTVEDLQKEIESLSTKRSDKEKLIKDSAQEIAALNYRSNQLEAELETLKRAQEELAKQQGEDLETKFAKLKEETVAQIQFHLNAAKASFDKAVELSEATAIPFKTSIVDLSIYSEDGHISRAADVYVPTTCGSTWGDLMPDGIGEFVYDEFGMSPGWYYDGDYNSGFVVAWAPSSMRC